MLSVIADAKGVADVIQELEKYNYSSTAFQHAFKSRGDVALREIMTRTIANTAAVVDAEEAKRKRSTERASLCKTKSVWFCGSRCRWGYYWRSLWGGTMR